VARKKMNSRCRAAPGPAPVYMCAHSVHRLAEVADSSGDSSVSPDKIATTETTGTALRSRRSLQFLTGVAGAAARGYDEGLGRGVVTRGWVEGHGENCGVD
jgi:hypothetical protein